MPMRKYIKSNWGKKLFWVWLSVFTVLTVWALMKADDANDANRELALNNRNLALESKRLSVENRSLAKQGKEAHDSLCILRVNLTARISTQEIRINTTRQFLFITHRTDKEILGLPRKVFEDSLRNSERDLTEDKKARDSLKNLDCIPAPKPKGS